MTFWYIHLETIGNVFQKKSFRNIVGTLPYQVYKSDQINLLDPPCDNSYLALPTP